MLKRCGKEGHLLLIFLYCQRGWTWYEWIEILKLVGCEFWKFVFSSFDISARILLRAAVILVEGISPGDAFMQMEFFVFKIYVVYCPPAIIFFFRRFASELNKDFRKICRRRDWRENVFTTFLGTYRYRISNYL